MEPGTTPGWGHKVHSTTTVIHSSGCFSDYLGMKETPDAGQIVNLGEGCLIRGTIVHELAHALGLVHEMTRPDRNESVLVYEDNILPNGKSQFAVNSALNTLTPYDPYSVMQYGNEDMARPGARNRTTVISRAGIPLRSAHRKKGLSENDAIGLNRLYKCSPVEYKHRHRL